MTEQLYRTDTTVGDCSKLSDQGEHIFKKGLLLSSWLLDLVIQVVTRRWLEIGVRRWLSVDCGEQV